MVNFKSGVFNTFSNLLYYSNTLMWAVLIVVAKRKMFVLLLSTVNIYRCMHVLMFHVTFNHVSLCCDCVVFSSYRGSCIFVCLSKYLL